LVGVVEAGEGVAGVGGEVFAVVAGGGGAGFAVGEELATVAFGLEAVGVEGGEGGGGAGGLGGEAGAVVDVFFAGEGAGVEIVVNGEGVSAEFLSAGGIEGQAVGAEGAGTAPDAAVVGGVDVALAAVGGLEGTDAVGGVVIEREGAAGLGHLGEVAVGVVGVARHLDAVVLGVDDLDALGAGALGDGLGEAPGGVGGLRGDEALEFVELVGDFFAGHPVSLAHDLVIADNSKKCRGIHLFVCTKHSSVCFLQQQSNMIRIQ